MEAREGPCVLSRHYHLRRASPFRSFPFGALKTPIRIRELFTAADVGMCEIKRGSKCRQTPPPTTTPSSTSPSPLSLPPPCLSLIFILLQPTFTPASDSPPPPQCFIPVQPNSRISSHLLLVFHSTRLFERKEGGRVYVHIAFVRSDSKQTIQCKLEVLNLKSMTPQP